MKTLDSHIKAALAELQAEKAKLEDRLALLTKFGSTIQSKPHARGRRKLSKAGREAIAKAARKRWAAWRKAKAAKVKRKSTRKSAAKIGIVAGLAVAVMGLAGISRAQTVEAPLACPPISATRKCDLTYRIDSPSTEAIILQRVDNKAVILRIDVTRTGEFVVSPPPPAATADHVLAEVVACDFTTPVGPLCSAPAERKIFLPALSAPALIRAVVDALNFGQ